MCRWNKLTTWKAGQRAGAGEQPRTRRDHPRRKHARAKGSSPTFSAGDLVVWSLPCMDCGRPSSTCVLFGWFCFSNKYNVNLEDSKLFQNQLVDLISCISQVVARVNNTHFSLCQGLVSLGCSNCGCVFSLPLTPGTSPTASALDLRKQTSSGLHFLWAPLWRLIGRF